MLRLVSTSKKEDIYSRVSAKFERKPGETVRISLPVLCRECFQREPVGRSKYCAGCISVKILRDNEHEQHCWRRMKIRAVFTLLSAASAIASLVYLFIWRGQ